MPTINELYEEIEEQIKELYKDKHREEVLSKIDWLIKDLNWRIKQFQDYWIDELTRIWWRLAIYQYNLIEFENEALKNMNRAKIEANIAKSSIRTKLLEEKSEKKITAKEVDIKTDAKLARNDIILSLHEAEHNKMTSIKFSINMIVNRIESRIKYLQMDINPKFKNG